jgi:hypothetical protein
LHGLTQVASTVPANGDVNPYGVAVVPASAGRLTAGDILVSNFNDKANVQGTGTTLVQVSPAGKTSVFASISALPAGQACPLGMTVAPNGDLVVVNGNNGNAVEITPAGRQLATKTLIKNGAGDLFGIITSGDGLIIANDGTDALDEAGM